MTSRVTEAVKLYTPRQVGMAAFLGTPLGGAVLIALNYVRLGNRKGARLAIVLGFAATAALIGLALWLPIPKSFPHAVIPMLAAWAIWGITEWLQGAALAARRAEGATTPSTWAAAATGLLCGVLIAGIVVVSALSGWLAGPAERYYDRAVELQSRGDVDRAISYYDSAIARKGTFVEAYYNRALAYEAKGLVDREIADDDSALAHDPTLVLAYINRGIAYRKKGLIDRAIADYDSAIARQPDLAMAYYNRAIALGAKGLIEREIADYGLAIAHRPGYPDAYYNRGHVYAEEGQWDRAIADYDTLIAHNSKDAGAYYNRGLAHEQQGDTARAIADFKTVLSIARLAPGSLSDLAQRAEQQLRALNAFLVVKYLGAAYLIVLGLRTLRTAYETEVDLPRARRAAHPYWQGVFTEVLNPKTALFFLAFIPQFVDPAAPLIPQFLLLGAISVGLNTTADVAVVFAATPLQRKLRANPRWRQRQQQASGAVLIGLGAYVAVSRSS